MMNLILRVVVGLVVKQVLTSLLFIACCTGRLLVLCRLKVVRAGLCLFRLQGFGLCFMQVDMFWFLGSFEAV